MKITKSQLKQIIKEAAAEYVWGIKSPGRVANQYGLSTVGLSQVICEEIEKLLEITTPGGVATHQPDTSPAGEQASLAGIAGQDRLEDKKETWKGTIDKIVEFADEKLKTAPPGIIDPALISYLIDDFNKLMEQLLAVEQQEYALQQAETGAGQ
tara:strand:+ start:74 stop:535 length:462 start_codon:yes stop_codon:yes gene_type:complete